MRGNYKTRHARCPSCGPGRAERNGDLWGCGDLILIVLTFGAWLAFKAVWAIAFNPWRCARCGGRV